MGEADQLHDKRPPEGYKKKGGFKGEKMKCKFSSIMTNMEIEKFNHLFVTTEKPMLLVSPSSLSM